MTKKLKAILEASEEDISLDDVLAMNEPKDVNDDEGSIFESDDEDDDDEKLDEDELNATGHKDTNEGKSGGSNKINERKRKLAEKKLKESDDEDEDDDKNMDENEDFDAEGVFEPDDIISEARKLLGKRALKEADGDFDEDDMNESDDEDDDDEKLDEDTGHVDTNEGKSKGEETAPKSKDWSGGASIFEDINTIIQGKDEASADIFESEDEDDDDKDSMNEAEGDDEDEEEKKVEEAKKLKESKARAKKLAEKKKLKEAEEDDEDSGKDKVEIDEEDEDDDKLDESKTLSEKEQKIVMEALKLPKTAQKEIKTIFESMVQSKVKSLKKSLNEKAKAQVAKQRDELIEALELYSKETIRKWKEENKPIFESQAKMKKLEEGFKAMSNIFAELGFQTVLAESQVKNKYTTLVKEHKALLERNTRLEEYVERAQVKDLYESAIGGLSNNQKRKFVALAESLEYDNIKDLKEKLDTLKKLFVEKKKFVAEDLDKDDDKINEEDDDNLEEGVILAKESRAVSGDLISESLKILSR